MAVTNPTNEAQSRQVPPEIRRFAQEYCPGLSSIERFSDDNEALRRGWTVVADKAHLKHLPDGYGVGIAAGGRDGLRFQIVEE